MNLHYYRARSGSPLPPAGARFISDTITSQTPTEKYSTTVFKGDNGDVMTIQVSGYSTNNANSLFKVNGTTYVLGNTFGITLDGSGNGSINVYVKGGLSSGNAINVTLQITIASGVNGIGSPSTNSYLKVI